MTFILSTDPDYLIAKRIKQGASRLDPTYGTFVERFRARYGISPLTISLDSGDRPRKEGATPRLAVVLERTAEYRTFHASPFGFDKTKQKEIARLLTETVTSRTLNAKFALPRRVRAAAIAADEIFVCFEDFERVAKWEAHDLASPSELDTFSAGLGIADQFWCLQRFAGPPIVFVHTDQQAEQLRASALPARWADTYFEIAKRHDEFGYLERAEITIQVDSKENFDTNYSSSWYYYFK